MATHPDARASLEAIREALEEAVLCARTYYMLLHDPVWHERLVKWEAALLAPAVPHAPEEPKDSCEWPGCGNPALCSSGNFGGRLVCREHFSITNGPAVSLPALPSDLFQVYTALGVTNLAGALAVIHGFQSSAVPAPPEPQKAGMGSGVYHFDLPKPEPQ